MNNLGGVYTTGTLTIAGDGITVSGAGTLWGPIAEIGDWILVGGQVGLILTVTDDTHLILQSPWQGTLPSASAYVLIKMSWLRYEPALTQAKLRELLAHLEGAHNFIFTSVAPPDPAIGQDGDWALKTDTLPWQIWLKEDGIWVEQPPNTAILPEGTSGYHLTGKGLGSAAVYEGFVQAGTGIGTRSWQNKARDIVDLRDWSGLDLTDTSDNATLLQNALNQTAAVGCVLNIPVGKIKLGSTINVPPGARICGQGQSGGTMLPDYDPYTNNHSWFHFAHTAIGLLLDSPINSARSIRGLNFYRSQPAIGPGWTPADADFDIRVGGSSDVIIEDCMFLNPTRMIQQIRSQDEQEFGSARLRLINIKGFPIGVGLDISGAYDVDYFDSIHLYPFWTGDPIVVDWTLNNGVAFKFGRVDNPVIGGLFAFGYLYGLVFVQTPDGTGWSPGGTASLFQAQSIGLDGCKNGIITNADTNVVTVNISNFYAGGQAPSGPTQGATIIQLNGTNARFSFGTVSGFNAQEFIAIVGTNNVVTVAGALRGTNIQTYLVDVTGASNKVRLGMAPTLDGTTPFETYIGTGIIETPDWRSYTPVVGATVGAFPVAPSAPIVTGTYRRIGKTIDFEININIPTNGTAAGQITVTLPFVAGAGFYRSCAGKDIGLSNKLVSGHFAAGSSTMTVQFYDATYPGADGTFIAISGTYEAGGVVLERLADRMESALPAPNASGYASD